MDDRDVMLALQDAGHELNGRFPDRAWSLFVWPAEPGQRARYISNAPRSQTLKAMKELAESGMPGIPESHSDS
jgi:hypothetical protein